MKLNKKKIFTLIYIIYIVCVFFVRWLFNNELIKLFSLFIIPLLIIFSSKKSKSLVICILFFSIYIFLNLLFTNFHKYFFNELIVYTLPNFAIAYYFFEFELDRNYLKKIICEKSFYFFNIYMLLNIFIMIKQLNYSYFLMFHFNGNNLYLDQITGMLGVNGTHRLALFYIIILYLNYYNFKNKNRLIRNFSKIMFIISLIFSIYISIINNNRAYYFMLLIFSIPLILKTIKNSFGKSKKAFKFFIVLFLIIFSLPILYYSNKSFNVLVNNIIVEVLERTSSGINTTNFLNSSEERIKLFNYALSHNGYLFGNGIGSIKLLSDSSMPIHFGISEITSRVYTGGLLYIGIIFLIYYVIIVSFFKKKTPFIKIYILFSLGFLTAFQQIFTIPEEIFLTIIIYILLSLILEEKNEENA